MIPVLGFVGPIGWQELLIVLVLVLIVFGPRKLPEIAEAFGKSINKFKSATRDATDDVKRELDDARRNVQDDPSAGRPRSGSTVEPEAEAEERDRPREG